MSKENDYRGAPVTLPKRKMHQLDPSFLSESEKGWNACLDEIAKMGPLYTHPAQGEPVAWFMPELMIDNTIIGSKVKAAHFTFPLYAHADPAEVEQLRLERDTLRSQLNALEELSRNDEVERLRGIICMHEKAIQEQGEQLAFMRKLSVTNILMTITPGHDGMGHEHYANSVAEVEQKIYELSVEVDEQRAQLAERDSLLREARDDLADWANTYSNVSSTDTDLIIEKVDATLSASAEPSFENKGKAHDGRCFAAEQKLLVQHTLDNDKGLSDSSRVILEKLIE